MRPNGTPNPAPSARLKSLLGDAVEEEEGPVFWFGDVHADVDDIVDDRDVIDEDRDVVIVDARVVVEITAALT